MSDYVEGPRDHVWEVVQPVGEFGRIYVQRAGFDQRAKDRGYALPYERHYALESDTEQAHALCQVLNDFDAVQRPNKFATYWAVHPLYPGDKQTGIVAFYPADTDDGRPDWTHLFTCTTDEASIITERHNNIKYHLDAAHVMLDRLCNAIKAERIASVNDCSDHMTWYRALLDVEYEARALLTGSPSLICSSCDAIVVTLYNSECLNCIEQTTDNMKRNLARLSEQLHHEQQINARLREQPHDH